MSQRYFLAQPPEGHTAVLDGDEARHLSRVMRAKPGDSLTLFDGAGRSWPATITSLDRTRVELALGEVVTEPTATSRAVTLAVALPKGDRQKWLIEKLTELGVTHLIPLRSTRSVAEPTAAALDRLRRGVIEACKQCGRSRLLEIGPPQSLADLLASEPETCLRLLTDREGIPFATIEATESRDLLAAIGPEGGFTTDEIAAAEAAGFIRVSLSQQILRIETAAVALAAVAGQGHSA